MLERDGDPAWSLPACGRLRSMAADQLGTVGGGNHYVDLFLDELDRVWIGCHFGSRGLGHKTATWFLKEGGAKEAIHEPPLVLGVDTPLGQDYLAAMALAGRYAYAGRDWVCAEVARIIGADIVEEVHNHHNYCIPGDEVVPTPAGPARMRDLKPGDRVYSLDVKEGLHESSVVRSWQSGRKAIVRISTFGRSLRASLDHPVLVVSVASKPHPDRPWHQRRTGSLIWKNAGDIVPGDVVVCCTGYYRGAAAKGTAAWDSRMARFTGAFLGDGWTRARPQLQGHTVGLAIGGPNDDHTERYRCLVMELFLMLLGATTPEESLASLPVRRRSTGSSASWELEAQAN